MSSYLDTNVVFPLFVTEPATDAITAWLAAQDNELFVADLVIAEFHAALSRVVRQRIVTGEQAGNMRKLFDLWRASTTETVENLPGDIRAAIELVKSPHPRLLSADAIHLATCRRLGLTLITLDTDLQAIATREGVRWISPPALS